MRLIVRKTYAHEWSAIDEENYVDITSPMGLGNSRETAIDDLMRQLDQGCKAFDCAWPVCGCGERGK